MRYLIVVAILIGAGCEAPAAAVHASVGTRPDRTKPLLAASDVPLEWSGAERRGDTLIVAAAKRPEVWRIPLDSGAPKRLFEDTRSGLAISRFAMRGRELGLFRLNGDLNIVDDHGRTQSRSTSRRDGMTKPMAVAARGDHWLTGRMLTSFVPGSGERRGEIILESIDSAGRSRRIFGEVQWTNDEFWARAFDLRGVTFAGDTAMLTGITPPRIVMHAFDTGTTDTIFLQDAPERRMAPKELKDLEKSLQGVPDAFRQQLVLPEFQPAVVEAWPYGAGLLVMAYGPEQEPILDWYCGAKYRRTLIEDPALTEMFRIGDEFITVAEGDPDYELRIYRLASLQTTCP